VLAVAAAAVAAEAADSPHILDAGYCLRCLLLLYGRHLGRTVPIIRPIISSLVPVIRVMELLRCSGTTVVPLLELSLTYRRK
jgi:hypothetical protein